MSEGGQDVSIDLIHYPVSTLGPGRRIGIWFQGCPIRCVGCIAVHAWERTEEKRTTVGAVLERVRSYLRFKPEGVTISGGEPFAQDGALYEMLRQMRGAGVRDILLYSGYRYRSLRKRFRHITSLVDVLVEGEYVEGWTSDRVWKGSGNQRMIILARDEELRRKYGAYKKCGAEERKLQVVKAREGVYVLGIPGQEDAEAIRHGFS